MLGNGRRNLKKYQKLTDRKSSIKYSELHSFIIQFRLQKLKIIILVKKVNSLCLSLFIFENQHALASLNPPTVAKSPNRMAFMAYLSDFYLRTVVPERSMCSDNGVNLSWHRYANQFFENKTD